MFGSCSRTPVILLVSEQRYLSGIGDACAKFKQTLYFLPIMFGSCSRTLVKCVALLEEERRAFALRKIDLSCSWLVLDYWCMHDGYRGERVAIVCFGVGGDVF